MLELDFAADVVNLMMRDLVPFSAIFVLNTLAMIRFRQMRKLVAGAQSDRNERKSRMFFIAIFASNTIFLLIYTPWSICFVLHHVNETFGIFETLVESSSFLLVWDVVNSLSFLNNMTPFFIHLAFNSLFRNELNNFASYYIKAFV